MNVSNAKILDVVNANGIACIVYKTFFHESKETSLVAEMTAFVNGKVTDVKFIQHCVRIGFKLYRLVAVPACGICLLHIYDHAHDAVYACGLCIDIDSFLDKSVMIYLICIVYAVKVAVSHL